MTDQATPDNYAQEWEEVWLLFDQEGKEALELVEEMLIKAESNPGKMEQIAELFRAIHNFKGMARMMGLSVTESLAHRAEDLIALVRDEGVMMSSPMISLLLEALDRLRGILDNVLVSREDVEARLVAGLMERLEAMHTQYTKLAPAALGTPVGSNTTPPADTLNFGTGDILTPINSDFPPAEVEKIFFPTSAAEVLPLTPPEQIDPASDPAFVQIFLELARDGVGRLHTGLDVLPTDNEAGQQEIEAVAENLKHAAAQMGYARLVATLDDILTTAAEPAGEARTIRLNQAELNLFEELATIEDRAQSQHLIDQGATPDIAWLFRHWYAGQVFINLAQLSEAMDDLEQVVLAAFAESREPEGYERLVNKTAYLLRAIYHGCLAYDLGQVAHLTLALEDLYARIGQREIRLGEALINLTRSFVTQLGHAVQMISEGETPAVNGLEALLDQVEKILYQSGTNWVSQVTRGILDLLDLPAEFKDVITPESLLMARQALEAGARFYTVLANLDEDEAVGLAFYEWTQSNPVHLITNATVYQGQRSLFNFLLAATMSSEEVLAALAHIDPERRYLSLAECKLQTEAPLGAGMGSQPIPTPSPPEPTAPQIGRPTSGDVGQNQEILPATAEGQSLDNLMSMVGELVATHSSLHRTVDKLQATDLIETITGLMKQAGENGELAQHQVPVVLKPWLDNLQALAQIETEMSTALNRLHELTQALRVRPAAEILNALPHLARELADRQGKQVEVELKGADIELDRSVLGLLSQALQRLVTFVVATSLETATQRQVLHKTGVGRISVVLSKQEDHVQLMVADDGSGLDQAVILRRARELGWATGEPVAEEELTRWVLSAGFGLEEQADLAPLVSELQARRGQLKLTNQPNAGLKFELYLPLDMVMIDSMVVRAGKVHYVVPISAIRRIVKPEAKAVIHASAGGGQSLLRLEDTLIPIQSLSGNGTQEILSDQLLLIIEKDHQPTALMIDELMGQQQVLVRPLEGCLAQIPHASGCAVLGEGDIGLVLSLH